ncbi:MAG TPA: DsbA family protein [Solirubrobacteraceae bacterium]|nr:DsbA family protein [Solirubrobacteraceae bacterium]
MPPAAAAWLHFDLACPFSYLALECLDRRPPAVRWRPTCAEALHRGDPWTDDDAGAAARAAAERRAAELHLPLSWPADHPRDARGAMRAALYADELDRGGAFALAAARLAFCGGFDLNDLEVLAEAAAAAGVPLDGCLAAAGDVARDGPLEEAGRRLLSWGADRVPVLRIGRVLHCGEQRVAAAAAMLRSPGFVVA